MTDARHARHESGYQERSARWLLLLVLLHAVPVIWITPVAGGSAPAAALLAFGLASLFTFDSEGVALGLFALLPGLVYLGIGWALAWLLARLLRPLARAARGSILAVLVLVPLCAVYFPIFVAGGHNSSSNATLLEVVAGFPQAPLLGYWIGLHVVVAVLLAMQLVAPHGRLIAGAERWTGPVLKVSAALLGTAAIYLYYPTLVCRPLAQLGNDRAQLCVARTGGPEARYWYERAAADGNTEALLWVLDNTPNRIRRLEWLRRGAEAGDPVIQHRLAQHLVRYGGVAGREEATAWLLAAADADYGPAQFALAQQLATTLRGNGPPEDLARYRALLEEAAGNGSEAAALRLAEHYARGSLGYPVAAEKAIALYREWNRPAAAADLQASQAAIDAGDPGATLAAARRYLASPLPGPGVRELGLELFGRVAATDPAVRSELIVMLRTGSDGAERDLEAAAGWLLQAAEDGDVAAMDRVARNYMDGREGFAVDIPRARVWIAALQDRIRRGVGPGADAKLRELDSRLRYLDRLAGMAGGRLVGADELESLGRGTDADSHYRFALQLLAGHGASRRAEAVSRLQQAADLGHADAAWRLVQIYERGFRQELDPAAARRELERAAELHHFEATRELASRYEYGKHGYQQDLPRAIAMYEAALAAGRDNRYGWDLDPAVFNHFPWLESRLRQARMKLDGQS